VRRENVLLLLLGLAGALWWYSRTSSGQGVIGSISDYVGNLLTPRGIRNNNPGNVVRSSIQWQGSLTPDQVAARGWTWDPTFEQMDTPADGVRMIGHILTSYSQRGLTTVDQIIRSYSTTDQDAYVTNVAAALGVGADDPIDVTGNLPALATAIIEQENGTVPYSADDIAQWVYS
jgi:hypothetical protein